MPTAILATKLFIPTLRTDLLPRPTLVEKLNQSKGYPLTLISASAGSGKTTILSEWVAGSDRTVAWISLDPGDNDPAQFLLYFISALRTIRENFGETALENLQSQTDSLEAIMIGLINDIANFPEDFTLILDDFHVIKDPRINEFMTFMIDHLPAQMHVIVSSRNDPIWPVARYRVRNQILELRGRDLRFSLDEAAEFLNHRMGLNLSVDDLRALEERTEGWVAGLQLAALSMKGQVDIPGFIRDFTGSHLYVAEYLVEEIFKQLSEEMQSFLLRTSVLDRLNGGLCETVSGCPDGRAMLESLHKTNVFVIRLDQRGEWYRYHHLFADLLRARLQQTLQRDEITILHQRAADWFSQNGYTPESVKHSLAAKDFERVANLVKKAAHNLIFSGRVKTLRDWLDDLPQSSYEVHPQLVFYLFWIDILQSRADLSERSIQEKVELLKTLPSSTENDRLRGELMAVVCRAVALSGRTSEGIALAQEALAYLPLDDRASRARVNSALATAHDLEGRAQEAEPAYRESISDALAAGDYRLAAHTMMMKGLVQSQYGHLHEAVQTFQAIIDMADRATIIGADKSGMISSTGNAGKEFFPAGQGYIGLASIYLEWNDINKAESYLERGMALCRRGGLDGIFIGREQMSRLRLAKGDLEGALQEIQMPKQANRADDFNIAIRQIQIALAKEDQDVAWRWAQPLVKILDRDPKSGMPLLFLEMLEAVLARVYLAKGEIGKALQLLARLQATAEPDKRIGRLIEVYLLRALAEQMDNQGSLSAQAIENVERALALAKPEGYFLLLLEAGPVLMPLLAAVEKQRSSPEGIKDYAHKLLDAFGNVGVRDAARHLDEVDGLVEQLTQRELEVLELLAAGDSNQTIAEKLVITVRTVKKHASNIYGKLNVDSRTQAGVRARELGLLTGE